MAENDPTPDSEDARYETFVQRFAHYEPDLRRFIRSLLPTWTDTDEVLQQTAIVIWRKFDQIQVPKILNYLFSKTFDIKSLF